MLPPLVPPVNASGIGEGIVPPGKLSTDVKVELASKGQLVTLKLSPPGDAVTVTTPPAVPVGGGAQDNDNGLLLTVSLMVSPEYVAEVPGLTGAFVAGMLVVAENVPPLNLSGSGPLTSVRDPVIVTEIDCALNPPARPRQTQTGIIHFHEIDRVFTALLPFAGIALCSKQSGLGQFTGVHPAL